jgi:hypothetical protein
MPLGDTLAAQDLEVLDVLGHETAVPLGGPGEDLVVGKAGERSVGRARTGADVPPEPVEHPRDRSGPRGLPLIATR